MASKRSRSPSPPRSPEPRIHVGAFEQPQRIKPKGVRTHQSQAPQATIPFRVQKREQALPALPVPARIFKRPELPIREKQVLAPAAADPLTETLLSQFITEQQSNDAKCAEWVQNKAPTYQQMSGFAAPAFAHFAGRRTVFADEDEDAASFISEATLRPMRKAGPETSYFESDVDDPTVIGDSCLSDDEPDNVFVTSAAKSWIFGPQSKGKYFLPSDVKHKAALLTIEKHWGGQAMQIIPAPLRPLRSSSTAPGGRMDSGSEMEWDKDMVAIMKKIARVCSLKEFELTMNEKLKHRTVPGLPQGWLTREDLQAFYESLKNCGRLPRTLDDVASDGPNVDGTKVGQAFGYFPASPAPR
ncbi:hypothetical protein LTR85_010074 [Meristemomyces frigidus]|nr:hypothetical protein LTR85_010074 [Meristemomyces frigidus]